MTTFLVSLWPMFEFGCSVANLGATLNARSVSTNWGQGKNIKKSKSFPKQKVAGSNPAREKGKRSWLFRLLLICVEPDDQRRGGARWQPIFRTWASPRAASGNPGKAGGWGKAWAPSWTASTLHRRPQKLAPDLPGRLTLEEKLGDIENHYQEALLRIPSGAGHLFNYHLRSASLK